jgi:hypothetical protein
MTDRSHITLYSGGHKGAESEFGRLAEAWGIQEVNFSFEGHAIERSRGVRMLDSEALEKGNVSMEIVSARMGRKFTRGNKIRKVIQTIFHMVNNGYHVIAVGWIQPDDTVKGGPDGGLNWPSCSTGRCMSMIRIARAGSPGKTTHGCPNCRRLKSIPSPAPAPGISPTTAGRPSGISSKTPSDPPD